MERMEGVQFSKRADALKVEGRGRRERPRLRGLREERFSGSRKGWRMRARDRGEWR